MYASSSNRRRPGPWWLGVAVCFTAACGDDASDETVAVPSPAATQAYFGLNPGSCVTYRFTENNLERASTASVEFNDRNAGFEGVQWNFKGSRASSQNRFEWVLQAVPGAMSFVRATDRTDQGTIEDSRVYFRCSESPCPGTEGQLPPLFQTVFGLDGAIAPAPRVESNVRPEVQSQDYRDEQHRSVLQIAESEFTFPGEEPVQSFVIGYTREDVSGEQQVTLEVVPNVGIVRVRDRSRDFFGCSARVCDAEGTCTGACPANCP